MIYCEQYKLYRDNAKRHIERELAAAGIKGWIIDEAVRMFENGRYTETKIIELYLKR